MFRPHAIFLCAMALASASLASTIFIASPSANSDVISGKNITVQLGENVSLADIDGAGVSINISPCTTASDCPGPGWGQVIYFGTYHPEQYKDESYAYENITVTIPPLHNGPYVLAAEVYPLTGKNNVLPPVSYTSTEVNVVGSN